MRWFAVLLGLAVFLYPVLVYLGGQWLEPRYLGLVLLGLYVLRGLFVMRKPVLRLASAVLAGLMAMAVWWLNSDTLLLLVPAAINALMALLFAHSLYHPPTIPARVAARIEGELTPEIVRYTDQVTRLWLVFFCLNGAAAVVTALWASREIWLLYNGVIAYILIGLMFGGEYAYRQCVIKKPQV